MEEELEQEETLVLEFSRYFTIEEAVALLPSVREDFGRAHQELNLIRDELILYKRLHDAKLRRGKDPSEEEATVLKAKWDYYEKTFRHWLDHFANQGIEVRDMERGLIDFPYQARNGDIYFLCWYLGDDGLFYFHDLEEGFRGRKPITLLPE